MKLNWKLGVGTLVLAGTFFAGAPSASSQVSIGIQIGAPPAPRVYPARPPCPGPVAEYSWVEGYWYPVSGHYYWHKGYWTRPPYAGAVWVVPHYETGHYYGGYWQGPHGRFECTGIDRVLLRDGLVCENRIYSDHEIFAHLARITGAA